jgi:hypothetical protein
MNDMQTALKNPHYKIIWEKVIMNRHPDCETLEKALLHESSYSQCLVLLDNKIYNIYDDCIEYNLNTNIIRKTCYYEAYIDYVVYKAEKTLYKNFQILGRIITLEDILILLRPKGFNPFISYHNVDNIATLSYFPEQEMQDIIRQNGMRANAMFFWQLTKPLSEQTHETWERIANLF